MDGMQLIHRVAYSETRIRIGEASRATGTAMTKCVEVRPEHGLFFHPGVQDHATASTNAPAKDEIRLLSPFLDAQGIYALRFDNASAVELPAVCQRSIDPGDPRARCCVRWMRRFLPVATTC